MTTGTRFIWMPSQSPYHNLAAEEYLLTQTTDNVFMLWQNRNAVIVGRHQNTLAEINTAFVEKEHIDVVRRLTGGGAVFHDLGNLNFSFIQNAGPQDKEIDFVKYLRPVLEALQSLGVPATFSGRNDIVIGGKKISGNAMAFHGSRVLEHGTLLFDTRPDRLAQALKADPAKFADKAVKSVRSRVTDIAGHLPRPMTVMAFKDRLTDFVAGRTEGAFIRPLTKAEEAEIQTLADKKYSTWDWNYGNSPKYGMERKVRTRGGTIQVCMTVSQGLIKDLHFYGDFFSRKDPGLLAARMTGLRHEAAALAGFLDTVAVGEYFCQATGRELLQALL